MIRQRVEKVSDDRVALLTEQVGSPDTTTALYDREWGLVASGYNEYRPALRYYSFPLYAGKRWGIDSAVSNFGAGQTGRVKGEAHAAGWENVDVAAGKYLALRIEIDVETADPGSHGAQCCGCARATGTCAPCCARSRWNRMPSWPTRCRPTTPSNWCSTGCNRALRLTAAPLDGARRCR